MKAAFFRLLCLLCLCLLAAGVARAEMIRELVTVQGAMPMRLDGIGVVTGLDGTGEKDVAALKMIRDYMSNNGFNVDLASLSPGSVALVQVTAEMPAFSRPGQNFAVTVTSYSNAKSLAGGELLKCDLYGSDPNRVMARATGRVVVGATNLNRGFIPSGVNSGAQQLDVYPLGQIINEEGIVRLDLIAPDWTNATNIARQINQTPSLNPFLRESSMFAESETFREVAIAVDPGQVRIEVPDQYRFSRLTTYVSNMLEVPVAVSRPATILINRSKNTIVITGDVRVNNATVSIQDKTVTVRPEMDGNPPAYVLENDTPRNLVELEGPGSFADLQGLIDTLNAMGLTTEQIITVFENLREAGAINAKMISN